MSCLVNFFNLVAHCTGLIYQEGKFMFSFITNVLISLWRSSSSNRAQSQISARFMKSMCLKSANQQQQQTKPQKPSKQRTTHKAKTKNRRYMPNTYKSNSRCSHSFLKHQTLFVLSSLTKKRCLPSYLYFDLSWNHQVIITSITKKRCVNCETFQCLKIELPVVYNILCTCRDQGEEKKHKWNK